MEVHLFNSYFIVLTCDLVVAKPLVHKPNSMGMFLKHLLALPCQPIVNCIKNYVNFFVFPLLFS
jgi:hypothetical protein